MTFFAVHATCWFNLLVERVNCLPVTELVNVLLGLYCNLQKTQPPHGISSALDPISELEADSEPIISLLSVHTMNLKDVCFNY